MFKDYLESIDLLESAIKSANNGELRLLLANNTIPLYMVECFNYGIPCERILDKALYDGNKHQVLIELASHKEKIERLKMFIDAFSLSKIKTNPNEFILKNI